MMTLHPSSGPLSAVQERVLWILKLTNDYEICCDGRGDLHEKIKVGEGKYFEWHTENASFRSMSKKPVVKTGLRTLACIRKTFSCDKLRNYWNRFVRGRRVGDRTTWQFFQFASFPKDLDYLLCTLILPFSKECSVPFCFEATVLKSTHSGQLTALLSFLLTRVRRLPLSQEFANFANIFDCSRP